MSGKITVRESRKNLAIDLSLHCLTAVFLAFVFFRVTGGLSWPFMAVIGSVFIDLDHFFDHFLYYGLRGTASDFMGHRYLASGKVYVPLHSWEIVVFFAVAGLFFRILVPLSCGMAAHLLVDQFLSHKRDPLFYFLFYRVRKKFDVNELSSRWSSEE